MIQYTQTRIRLLVVGATGAERRSLCEISEAAGWDLQEKDTCENAVAFLKEHPVEIVLCGIQMPDGCWRRLLEQLRECPGHPQLIVFSRLADSYLWGDVLNLGGCDVIATPFEPQELIHVVSAAWRQRQYECERAASQIA